MKSQVFQFDKYKWEVETIDDKGIVIVQEITPKVAEILLKNQHNRAVSNQRIDIYARDMRCNRWMIGCDAITFDKDGRLINGQHRLMAIVRTKLPQTFIVRFGCQIDEQSKMDGGRMRSLYDVATLEGMDISGFSTSIGRYIRHQTAVGLSRHNSTRMDDVRFLQDHIDSLKWAAEMLRPKLAKNQQAPVPKIGNDVASAFARAYYHYRGDATKFARLEQLGKSLVQKDDYKLLIISDDDGDSVFDHFISVLVNTQGNQGQVARNHRYRKAEKAIKCFVEGKKVKLLKADSDELFLLPVEIEAKKSQKAVK